MKFEKNIKQRLDVILSIFLALTIYVIYRKILTYGFIGYDDDNYVTENSYVLKGISKDGLIWAFRSTYASNWHPITWLSHMLDIELYGMNAGAHHATSLFFHILNSLLLFLTLRLTTKNIWRSWAVAFLFAIHPFHVESVAWIAERKDVVSTFFGMLTILSYVWYVKKPGLTKYISVVILFNLALMAKPMMVTLPFLLLLIDYWPLQRIEICKAGGNSTPASMGLQITRLLYEKIPLILLTAISCVLTFFAQWKGGAVGTTGTHPLMMRIGNICLSYVTYLYKTIFAYNFGILYPYPNEIIIWKFFGAVIVLSGITFLTIKYSKQFQWLFVGWFWYLGMLVPVIGAIQVGVQSMADRYTYTPLIGIFIIFSWGTTNEFFCNWRYKKTILTVIAIGYFSAMTAATWRQTSYWKDSIRLFEHTLAITDDNYIIHNNLGFELVLRGQNDDALKHYEEALRINPNFEQAHINYGSLLFYTGRQQDAFSYYQKTLVDRPEMAGVHYNFGVLLLKAGKNEQAEIHFKNALRIKNDYAEAYNGLGAIMVSRGLMKNAYVLFKKSLQINPNSDVARENLMKIHNYMKENNMATED